MHLSSPNPLLRSQVTLTDIEVGFDYQSFTGTPIMAPGTLAGLARHAVKSLRLEYGNEVYTAVWIPRTSRGAGTRHDIGAWGRMTMALHETRSDALIKIIGWAAHTQPPAHTGNAHRSQICT